MRQRVGQETDERVFPAFQFRDGDVLSAIAEVLSSLDTDSPFAALAFLVSKNPEWSGKSAC